MSPVFCDRGVMSINQVSAVLTMHLQTLKEVLTVLQSANIILHNGISLMQKRCGEIKGFCGFVAYLDVCEVLQQLCRLLMLSTHLHNLCKHSTLVVVGFENQSIFGFGDQVLLFGDQI